MLRFRMLLVAGLVAVVAGCGGKHDSASAGPAVVAGATVGTVIKIGGKVTATRAGQTRDLAAGSEVSGDDTIATGADSLVMIELAHNGAHWELGANKSGLVAESVAWALPRATGPAGTVEGDMSAGGRHSEKSSIETVESTTTTKSAPVDKPAPAHVEPERARQPAEDAAKVHAATKAAPPPPPPPPPHDPKGGGQKDDLDALLDGKARAPDSPSGGGEREEDPRAAALATKPLLVAALTPCVAEGATVQVKVKCADARCELVPDAKLDAAIAKCIAGKIGSVKPLTKVAFVMPLALTR